MDFPRTTNDDRVIWTNADTNIYIEIGITNLYAYDFDTIGEILEVRVSNH